MERWIVLLRGINVGGNKLVKMKILSEALQANGFSNVITLLQSGNVLVSSDDRSSEELESRFAAVMQERFGFTIPLAILSASDWEGVSQLNPFVDESESSGNWVQVYFGSTEAERESAKEFATSFQGVEQIQVVSPYIYSYFPEGIGTSELARNRDWIRITKTMTARNWNTIAKISGALER